MKKLNLEQSRVMLQKGTEPPFSGDLLYNSKKGNYECANCGIVLFDSKSKFDSGTGWPSFDSAKNVELVEDNNNFMKRIEVRCKKCGSHLGHLFSDGITKTKKRYCINSCALEFKDKV